MGVKAPEIKVSYCVKIAMTRLKLETGRSDGPSPSRGALPLSSRETGSSSVQDFTQVGVNFPERCVETDRAYWLDRIAQGEELQDSGFSTDSMWSIRTGRSEGVDP